MTTIALLIATVYWVTAPSANCSWYSVPPEGGLTASGAMYYPGDLICASPGLPLGTILRLYNPTNGIWLDVRCIDRGPFKTDSDGYATYPLEPHPTRQFDLSTAAFDSLGNLDDGVMTLRYRILRRDVEGLVYNLGEFDEAACYREDLSHW